MGKPRQAAAAKKRSREPETKPIVRLTPVIIEEILERIASGEAVHAICNAEPERMPTHGAFFQLVSRDEELSNRYARARESRAMALAEEALTIADDKTDDANSRRIRVDTRKWFASKLDPKKWGDKQTIETSGIDGGEIKTSSRVVVEFVRPQAQEGGDR